MPINLSLYKYFVVAPDRDIGMRKRAREKKLPATIEGVSPQHDTYDTVE